MKKIYASIILLLVLVVCQTTVLAKTAVSCNWKSKITSFKTKDTCRSSNTGKTSIYGSISLTSSSCIRYQWSVNGNTVSSGLSATSVTYNITQNGTYNLCLKLIDTCNKCDTTLCASFTISCFKTCNWKGRYPTFTTWDTCQGAGNTKKNSINGSISFNSSSSCFKYVWTVNNTIVGKGTTLNHKISTNGTYVMCLKVSDTCNKCDTTFCRTFNITCFSTPCDWKKSIALNAYNSCNGGKDTIKAYVYSQYKIYCGPFKWTLNNQKIGGNSQYLNSYPITQNGSYKLCVSVRDTCNGCDTTLCYSFTVSCFSNTKCKPWKGRGFTVNGWDTCKGQGSVNSINGSVSNSGSDSCYKYKWSVNNSIVGYGKTLNYKVFKNGTYSMCLTILDTCNNCDTSYCRNFTVSCFAGCNFKSKLYKVYFADTCRGANAKNTLNGQVYFNSNVNTGCFKYLWKVNGVLKGNKNRFVYDVTANGTYNVCLTLIDTCNKCDTTICKSTTISCFNSKCDWKKSIAVNYYNKCGTYYDTLQAYYYSNNNISCPKSVWLLNGNIVAANTYHFKKVLTQNGTYTLCLKLIDTCNKCDTAICKTFTVNCTKNKCKWYGRAPKFSVVDTCQGSGGKNSISGTIGFRNTSACIKYEWTVNGLVVSRKAQMDYKVLKNGTYNVCLYVLDSCDKCDTSFCITKTVSCFQTCNWKSHNPYFYTWDTCKGNTGNNSVNGYISFKNTSKCYKYTWTVNGYPSGNSNVMNRKIYANGTYVICLKVYDSCNKCDTTFCSTKTINCFKKCNFKARTAYFAVKDTCSSTTAGLNGYISFNNSGCLKYNWTVNNANAGTGSSMKYKVLKNGTYVICVKVTDTCNRCDTVYCKTVNFNCKKLATENINSQLPDVQVYPNPAGNKLFIDLPYTAASYEIANVLGVCIDKGELMNGVNTINTEGLVNGVYILWVNTDQGKQTLRVVINR